MPASRHRLLTVAHKHVYIAVMGLTGAGKSSFISLCSGKSVKVGDSLHSCTSVVADYAYDISPSCTVHLIDTPGFDDTHRTDADVLREIAGWLGNSHQHGIKLHGIIYIHRITDNRVGGSALRNIMMFRQLCGADALKKVILVTTMWDDVLKEGISRSRAETREMELFSEEYWGPMLDRGSSTERHYNTAESANQIIQSLVSHSEPVTTDIQRQLVEEHKDVADTSAGQELQSELRKQKAKWDQERQRIEEDLKEAMRLRDRETEQIMRQEQEKNNLKIKKVEEATKTLRSNLESLLAEREERMKQMEAEWKKEREEHQEQLKILREAQARENEARMSRLDLEDAASMVCEPGCDIATKTPETSKTKMPQLHHRQSPSWRGPRYSVAMHASHVICIAPKVVLENMDIQVSRSGPLVGASIGDKDPETNCRPVVLQYPHRDKIINSSAFENLYPRFTKSANKRTHTTLSVAALGPTPDYFASWWNNTWSYYGSDDFAESIDSWKKDHVHGERIVAVALGCCESYLISYGDWHNSIDGLIEYDLNGCYPKLESFLYEKEDEIEVVAITLHPGNTTDFIVIYKNVRGYKCRWYSHDSVIDRGIRNWWNASIAR